MTGTKVTASATIGNPGNHLDHVIGSGDFNGDGYSRHAAAEPQRRGRGLGDEGVQSDRQRHDSATLGNGCWHAIGTGDFTATALLWTPPAERANGAAFAIWEMNRELKRIGGGYRRQPRQRPGHAIGGRRL